MDVAVLGLAISDKEEIINCMHEMQIPLLECQFVDSVKIIETATVPLIKLKVNLQRLTEVPLS